MYRSTRPVSIFYKTFDAQHRVSRDTRSCLFSAVDSGGAGGARAPPEFGCSEKGRSLISAYWSLAITTNTPGFKKLSTVQWVSSFLNLKIKPFGILAASDIVVSDRWSFYLNKDVACPLESFDLTLIGMRQGTFHFLSFLDQIFVSWIFIKNFQTLEVKIRLIILSSLSLLIKNTPRWS